jgi:hypothetical protein
VVRQVRRLLIPGARQNVHLPVRKSKQWLHTRSPAYVTITVPSMKGW